MENGEFITGGFVCAKKYCVQRSYFQLAFILASLLIISCASKTQIVFQTPPPNSEAPIAFFGEGNMKKDMQKEYAAALQNSGIYNFVFDNFSEEQIENGIEIRLNYGKEKIEGKTHFVLKAEFIKDDLAWFSFTIKEEEKNKQILLDRFLQEVKRITTPPPPEPAPATNNCKG